MNNQSQRKKVALIGTGRFVEQTVLPSLLATKASYEVLQLFNRSGKLSDGITAQGSFQVKPTLEHLRQDVDVIFISVPQKEVRTVITRLVALNIKGKTILLTTPCSPISALNKLGKLNKYNRVLSFEFLPFHPAYCWLNSLVEEGKIGKLNKISLVHSGYLYHGLATIRMLIAKSPIQKSEFNKLNQGNKFTFISKSGVAAEMIGPKDYENGYFILKGERASITSKKQPCTSAESITFTYTVDANHIINRYRLSTGESYDLSNLIPDSTEFKHYLSTLQPFKQEFLIASVRYFEALANGEDEKLHSVADTLFEHWVIRITRHFKQFRSVISNQRTEFLFRLFEKLTS